MARRKSYVRNNSIVRSRKRHTVKSRRRKTGNHRSPKRLTRTAKEKDIKYTPTVDTFIRMGFEIISTNLEWLCPSSTTACKYKPVRPRNMGYSIWFSELKKSKDTEIVFVPPVMFGKTGKDKVAFQAVWMKNLRTRLIHCYGLHFLARFDATKLPPSSDPRSRVGQMSRLPLYPSQEDRRCKMPPMTQQESIDVLMSDLLRARANDLEYRFFGGTKYEFWSTGRLISFTSEDRSQSFYAIISRSSDLC